MIQAECHSDDFITKAEFDATTWFEQASDGEIEALAGCGWRGDYPADDVARYFEETETREVFDYVAMNPKMLNGDPVGFECSVDEAAAMAWLKEHRPEVCERISSGVSAIPTA